MVQYTTPKLYKVSQKKKKLSDTVSVPIKVVENTLLYVLVTLTGTCLFL